jgi:hypothetical protein
MTDVEGPVRYMERTRRFYRALGYTKDYVWAAHDTVPFARLPKPLAECQIALLTTAGPPDFDGVKRVWSGAVSQPPPRLFTDNLAWDKESTHTDDRGCFLPVEVASGLAADGMIAGLTSRFHGVPTEHGQRKTTEEDAPRILEHLREDGADAALLCPL